MLPSVLPRLRTDSAVRVFPGVWKLLSFLRLPSLDVTPSFPLLSLFLSFYIFSYLHSKTMGCFSGCLMSSASIQKLFCGIYSEFKCSFDEFVGEKVVSPSYSSAILGLSPILYFLYVLGNCINCVYCFLNFLHSNFEVLEHLYYHYSEFFFR